MAAPAVKRPYFPIIYVRGYAGSQSEVEETVATPYMGFNVGSTKIRQRWTGEIERTIFESPLVRLMKDHGYRDIYLEGAEMPPHRRIPARSIVIYRYYEETSRNIGDGTRLDIEEYAEGLSRLVLSVRDQVCGAEKLARRDCRVYLVAHSMGGLICRSFLQNAGIGTQEAKQLVDKVFTYATPHNGIDMAILGNVPGFFSRNNANNFNRGEMADYLGLTKSRRAKAPERVDSLNDAFDPDRFFCLVGTNYSDYEAGGGWVARLAGPMSDGLVRISNATVRGAPRAFVHRGHSGHYGIVNSEEGYQNLIRFLFGDVRVDGVLRIREITLPDEIRALHDERDRAGNRRRELRASYHVETVVAPRAATWDLHRRTTGEGSAVFRTYEELFEVPEAKRRHPHLFSTFLSKQARREVLKQDGLPGGSTSLGFSIDLKVLVPQYEIDGRLISRHHYRGGHLYQDKINVEAYPPRGAARHWTLKYGFDSETPNATKYSAEPTTVDGELVYAIPVRQPNPPGIDAEIVLTASGWNT